LKSISSPPVVNAANENPLHKTIRKGMYLITRIPINQENKNPPSIKNTKFSDSILIPKQDNVLLSESSRSVEQNDIFLHEYNIDFRKEILFELLNGL
jgi:hypothetical protein